MRIIVTGGWTLMKKDIPPTIAGAGGSSARRRAEPEQERAPTKAGETREKIEISAEQRARFRSISGSENPAFAVNLACQVEAAQWRGNSRSDKQQEEQAEAMLVAMSGMEWSRWAGSDCAEWQGREDELAAIGNKEKAGSVSGLAAAAGRRGRTGCAGRGSRRGRALVTRCRRELV
jgi:hypothetical protein